MREVDYRPKDVAIRDEPEAIEQRELRLAPVFATLGVLALLVFVVWGFSRFGYQVGAGADGLIAVVQTRIAAGPTPTATQTPPVQLADLSNENGGTPLVSRSGRWYCTGCHLGVMTSAAPLQTVEIIIRPTDTPLSAPTLAVTTTAVAEASLPGRYPSPHGGADRYASTDRNAH